MERVFPASEETGHELTQEEFDLPDGNVFQSDPQSTMSELTADCESGNVAPECNDSFESLEESMDSDAVTHGQLKERANTRYKLRRTVAPPVRLLVVTNWDVWP